MDMGASVESGRRGVKVVALTGIDRCRILTRRHEADEEQEETFQGRMPASQTARIPFSHVIH
jgi:hypothetical protein